MILHFKTIVVGYFMIGLPVIGMSAAFFLITFLPGLMRTTGEMIGAATTTSTTTTNAKLQRAIPSMTGQHESVSAMRS
jgi:hypothetical protein